MKVTKRMVDAMAKEMAASDWLPDGWDDVHDGHSCPTCGAFPRTEGDGGESMREQIAYFLKIALKDK